MADDARNRQNLDVNPLLQQRIKQLAKDLSVTESQLWNYFAASGLIAALISEDSELWSRLSDSGGKRYKKKIDIDDLLDQLK